MIQAALSTYAIQLTIVAIILIGCLIWMYLSIRKRFRNKQRDNACAGCSLSALCANPRPKNANKPTTTDHCPTSRRQIP